MVEGLKGSKYCFSWVADEADGFSVKILYDLSRKFQTPIGPANKFDKALILVWKTEVPIQNQGFRVKMFHE